MCPLNCANQTNKERIMRLSCLGLVLLTCLAASATAAQPGGTAPYPNRSVTIVVPFPPGGSADAVPRIVAEKLRERWGHPVIIENRPGNAGNTATGAVFRSPPDGYTLVGLPAGTVVINQFVQKKLPFEPEGLVPAALLAKSPITLSVRTSLPLNSVPELIAYAKKNPGKLTYATQGAGSTSHLTATMLQVTAGINLVHVPYKGSGPAMNDLIAGHVDMMFDTYGTSRPYHDSGRLKMLAVCTPQRLSTLPNMPTMQEAGLADFESTTWYGIFAPPGTPEEIVNEISRAAAASVALPEIQQRLRALGMEAGSGDRADFVKFVQSERDRWRRITKAANIVPE
jgi:tripartite-type tricarboxylate transporter receptor subunit TctC